ncbi:hypothetical protein [Microbacterium sp. J1-1]|uniref:hypothetical protein n=1 Tax=Microbacterium sp. J1-1 TaxID=2992441 RepID=UPI00211425BB|nr:hypothetical protein [Microbacterium sp. J1-1]UUE19352.1 hypothetical protein LRQ07_11075 [Microbacterium sp. J1-1]
MPTAQDIDDTAPVVIGFEPIPATAHVGVVPDDTRLVPERRGIWPLAPWRWVLLLTGIGLAATCGIPAAAPVWNGADLAVLISLAIFVAAFTPGRD